MRLTGNLSKIFAIGECEAISGLTCRIKYDGELPLPSEVFFVELDANGKGLGKAVRLIYPELKSGSQGLATFRLKHDAKIIELRGKWDGPWKNPY